MDRVDNYTLDQHVKHVCKPNLEDSKVKYCGNCPFEDIILGEFPDLKGLFIEKRRRRVENK